jgi:hypothetical protein
MNCNKCNAKLGESDIDFCNMCKVNNMINSFESVPKKKTRKEKSKKR